MTIADGQKIAIRFTQPLVGNVLGLDPPLGYETRKIDTSGITVSAMNEYSTSTAASYAIDGDTSTYWRSTTAVTWFQIKLLSAKVVTRLRLYLGSYYIKTFTFSGSNDGITWTQIGGEYTAASSTTAQWYTFEIENQDAYLYYRIDTLTAYSSRVYIYELELYETVAIGNHDKFIISFDEYDMVPEGSLSMGTRSATGIEYYCTSDTDIDLSSGSYDGAAYLYGALSLTYDEGVE